jgi:diguanylate cyclase (GGDEF)-like protein
MYYRENTMLLAWASGLALRLPFKSAVIERNNYRLFIALNYLCYLGIIAHLLFIPLFLQLGVPELAIINVFSVLLWVASYFFNRAALHSEAFALAATEAVAHAILATYFLGWDAGFYFYFFSTVLYIFLNHNQSFRIILIQSSLILLTCIGLHIYTHQPEFESAISGNFLDALYFMNLFVNFTAFGIQGYFFRKASTENDKKLELLATTDPLTGLFNRRKMLELAESEVVRFQRSKKPFLMAIADIDHFKQFNDNYGHDCGDYVLKRMSALIKETLRQQDVVSRWGGEEFLIMLPDTDLEGGIQAFEKLREMIANTQHEYAGKIFSITITLGVSQFDGGLNINDTIKLADEALYKGKREGRNRIVTVQSIQK